MKRTFILRDIYSGKLYKVQAYTAMEAARKLSQERRIPIYNIVQIQKRHALSASWHRPTKASAN